MKKVVAICPYGSVTGGPELIHQFVDALRRNSIDARILYYPYPNDNKTPLAYKSYDVGYATVDDCKDAILIVPELATKYLTKIEAAKKFVWWLSVDNYFKAHPKTFGKKIKYIIKSHLFNKQKYIPVAKLKNYHHLTQSHYGQLFLNQHDIYDVMHLSDYLGKEHIGNSIDIANKKNIICYNPKKGIETTKMLIANIPNVEFVPIQNMSSDQVAELLATSKIYIDFGNHPGKDRIPREAAMANCVVVTGIKGSANNNIDIASPSKYKLDEHSENFLDDIQELIEFIFNDFETALNDFEFYRNKIVAEKQQFELEVQQFIDKHVK